MGCDFFGSDVGRVGRMLSGLDCDFWDLGRWAVISLGRCWARGEGTVVRPKWMKSNGQIMGFGEMGCDLCGASVGRVGRGCCLDWGVV